MSIVNLWRGIRFYREKNIFPAARNLAAIGGAGNTAGGENAGGIFVPEIKSDFIINTDGKYR